MIKPKALVQFLENAIKNFTQIRNIFISTGDGSLLASTVLSDQDNTYIASFTNIFSDYSEIAKAKLSSDDVQANLNFAILDYEKGKVALSTICGELIVGVYTEKDVDIGVLFAEFRILRGVLNENLKMSMISKMIRIILLSISSYS